MERHYKSVSVFVPTTCVCESNKEICYKKQCQDSKLYCMFYTSWHYSLNCSSIEKDDPSGQFAIKNRMQQFNKQMTCNDASKYSFL